MAAGLRAYGRYCWMTAPHADYAHLAHDFADATLCGITLAGTPIRESTGQARHVCPRCAAAANQEKFQPAETFNRNGDLIVSYSEVLETRGNWRVRLELDEYADEPYDDGASPLLRLDASSWGVKAEHVMASGRPLDADSYIEAAAQNWNATPGRNSWRLFEKYLRAFYGVTQIKTWHSGSYWYVTYDSAAWREYTGAPAGSADMSEYRAWCEGDVYGWVLEKSVHWTAGDPDYEDRDSWEHADSCWGYYGRDYAEECAREELAAVIQVGTQAAEQAARAALAAWLG